MQAIHGAVSARVFDVLARHGVVPARCHTRLDDHGELAPGAAIAIDLHLAGVDAATARKLAHGLGRIVEVADVLIGSKCAPA